jgi:hypothetical protein
MALTDFENIGGPWQAENEPWRIRRNAQNRPRKPVELPTPSGKPSLIQQLLDENKKRATHILAPSHKFAPHVHLDVYQKEYERVYGVEKAKELLDANEAALKSYVAPVHHTAKWKPSADNWNHPSIQMLQTEYYSKCIRPPIDVRLKAHKEAGYPQEYLLQMLKKHEEALRIQPEVDEWFNRVMGPYAKKKETVPKPRTLVQIFKIKAPKVIHPDDDEEE